MNSTSQNTQPPPLPPLSPLSRAWNWSVKYSPLLNTYRLLAGKKYSKANYQNLLTDANLPKNLHTLIDTTVKKTKLWKSERADIAKELIAHTQDAIEANRTPEHIIQSFGDPKKVAKLLRRATKRKRPLYWRTLRNIRRSIAALTFLLFITYTGMAARFFTGKPNITKNYAVMVNAQNDAYAEDQKAWPIYQEIQAAWGLHIAESLKHQNDFAAELNIDRDRLRDRDQEFDSAGLRKYPHIPTDHHDYQETVQLFKAFEPQLKRLREATHRPILGIELGFNNGEDFADIIPPSNNPEENPSLINLLLPNLGESRRFANILAFDTLIAARESDSDRTYENLSATLALSRQKTFDHTLITSLVNIAIANLATNTIAQVINEHPSLLSRDHLIALSHELALTRPSLMVSYEGETMIFDDVLQRAYTDDGQGNGRITKNGLFMLINYGHGGWSDSELDTNPAKYLAGPVALALIPDRKSQATRHKAMMDTIHIIKNRGPQMMPLMAHQDALFNTERTTLQSFRYSAVDILMPALGSAMTRTFQGHMIHDATSIMLAIEIYKIDNGHPPSSLTKLIPRYLPTIPQDLFDPGQPLKYKLTDTGYTIYSVGSDADDDNATPYPIIESRWKQQTIPNFGDRYPYQLVIQNGKPLPPELNPDGTPKTAPPRGPDGDWILIDTTTPKQKESAQSPTPEKE